MFSFYLCIFVVIFLFQYTNGDWLELYTSVTQPVLEATQNLEANLAEVEVEKQKLLFYKTLIEEKLAKVPQECQNEDLKSHYSFFINWNFDSCVNLTDDWKNGADLAMEGIKIVLNITKTVGKIGNNILECPNEKLYKVLPCYNDNLINLKNEMKSIRVDTLPYIQKAMKAATNMRKDFEKCIGLHYTLKDKIESHIQNLVC